MILVSSGVFFLSLSMLLGLSVPPHHIVDFSDFPTSLLRLEQMHRKKKVISFLPIHPRDVVHCDSCGALFSVLAGCVHVLIYTLRPYG